MAVRKTKRGKTGRKFKAKADIPFTSRNYILFAIAIAFLALGYIALAQGPADSFWSLTLAPILLVIGYLIFIPWAIIHSERNEQSNQKSTNKKWGRGVAW